jgi:hypothetical protein
MSNKKKDGHVPEHVDAIDNMPPPNPENEEPFDTTPPTRRKRRTKAEMGQMSLVDPITLLAQAQEALVREREGIDAEISRLTKRLGVIDAALGHKETP